jgi:hypothetical protein
MYFYHVLRQLTITIQYNNYPETSPSFKKTFYLGTEAARCTQYVLLNFGNAGAA